MPKVLPLVTLPAPSLHERSIEIEKKEIGTPEFQSFLDDMIETMFVDNGVGIAAPQIGRNIRAFIILEKGAGVPYINPDVELLTDLTEDSDEGCLSVPGVFGFVKRAKKVRVRALNRHGRTVDLTVKGFQAIVFQHEFDHLNGILFVDKATHLSAPTDTKKI